MSSTQVARPATDSPKISHRDHDEEIEPEIEPEIVEILDGSEQGFWRADHDSEPSGVDLAVLDTPVLVIRLMLGFGRGMMAIGVLLLLFAAFQLWGTGLTEAKAQAELADRFEAQQAANLEDAATVGPIANDPIASTGSDLSGGTPEASLQKPEPLVVELPDDQTASTAASAEEAVGGHGFEQSVQIASVAVGDPVGVLNIPAIGVTKTVAEGTSRDVLRTGPGHYPSTPLPGQPGNVSIAGHRTTHGAPFLDIDKLNPGDEITLETVSGTYTYAVEGQLDESGNDVGHLIVKPEDVGVIMNSGDDRLTLTACHPKYSARQRIIVTAVLVGGPPPPALPDQVNRAEPVATDVSLADAAPAVEDMTLEPGPSSGTESLGWQSRYALPTMMWAAFTGLVVFAGWLFGRIWRRFPAYLMAVPPLTLCLYYCFVNLERFIPAV